MNTPQQFFFALNVACAVGGFAWGHSGWTIAANAGVAAFMVARLVFRRRA